MATVLLAISLLAACTPSMAAEPPARSSVTTTPARTPPSSGQPTSTPPADPSSPLVIAHRGGTADYPENTLLAFTKALENRVDLLWMTVQVTKDGVPVLYRPADLSALTNGSGKVADKALKELRPLNAGWNFKDKDGTYPYRNDPQPIPTLQEALDAVPPHVPIILDLKALPAETVAESTARVLEKAKAWHRVRVYSTETAAITAMTRFPQAQVFETRDATRQRLADVALAHQCTNPPAAGTWAGFELRRDVTVTERFTLGTGESRVKAQMWDEESVGCFESAGQTKIVMFGINTKDDYQLAKKLGAFAVLADSPRDMATIRNELR
ncbi:glycerophosphodiester phosphodiesterase family protein [Longimycelium tulufanense]|uniref:glycerophosphodiester phosphodiesterase family protein n=1 Tax=Longimycelium tulufanense TaxID=907463 RepID=UPI001E4694A6|nr:glycerophosphodiester phosphodiesterase family protein [Longimycelium tulufanense]